jgi:hypothetical protein
MTAPVVGADERDLRGRAARMDAYRPDGFDLAATEPQWLVGTVDRVLERLGEFAAAGIERVALQHHLFRDAAALELIAREILPAV